MMVMEYWTGWFDAWGDLHHVLAQEGRVVFLSLLTYLGFVVVPPFLPVLNLFPCVSLHLSSICRIPQ